MFKNHPKGLIVAFFTNMGERFGFYTMMAILVLFLQARYGLTPEVAGEYYSWFYFAIYALALIGGTIADYTKRYKLVILLGQIIMFIGYCMIAIPGISLAATMGSLLIIALGNGFFKGNLQAVVGQLYDNEKYAKHRESAFMIFYMGINIGAFFAPFVAANVRDWWLKANGFLQDASLPALSHNFLNGKDIDIAEFQGLADHVSGGPVADLGVFAQQYLDVFARGYNYAFAIAAAAMIVSLVVYLVFNKSLPNVEKQAKVAKADKSAGSLAGAKTLTAGVISLALMAGVALIFHFAMNNIGLGLAVGLFVGFLAMMFQISTKEERPRITALSLVFVVVVFFWMSFHQNGLTLTLFARDFTVKEVGPITYILFNLGSILCLIASIAGAVLALRTRKTTDDIAKTPETIAKETKNHKIVRIVGTAMFFIFGALCYYIFTQFQVSNPIGPEVFQAFNPLYIVVLTPVVMGMFAWMSRKGFEISTPKKIGFGMIIAAIGFLFVLIPSLGLPSPKELGMNAIDPLLRVSPYWLMSTYLVLTIAELFLSPMGLAFVSKVAPPRFQGLMQSGWLLATATGNKLLFIGTALWGRLELYMLWGVFIICCLLSAVFIFSIMKKLEKVTK